jgi:hypothetical protein
MRALERQQVPARPVQGDPAHRGAQTICGEEEVLEGPADEDPRRADPLLNPLTSDVRSPRAASPSAHSSPASPAPTTTTSVSSMRDQTLGTPDFCVWIPRDLGEARVRRVCQREESLSSGA